MGDLRRADSRERINDLLNDIKGIVNEHGATIDELKEIKKKNEELPKTKKRVDIPSIVAGVKKSEIDIPHRRSKASELHSEISRRSRYQNKEEREPPSTSSTSTRTDPAPFIEAEVVANVNAAPPPPPPPTEPDEGPLDEKRRLRREKSQERRRIIDAIRKKSTTEPHQPKEPAPAKEPSPVKRREPAKPKESIKPKEPVKSKDPPARASRERRRPAPPTVETGRAPREIAAATSPAKGLSPGRRSTTPMSQGRSHTPDYLYRIRRDSEGSVEIDFIEEHNVETEWQSIRSSRANSSDSVRRSSPAGNSLPRTAVPHQRNPVRRRIVVDRCEDCDGGDSPPEIEIRICKKGRCPKHEPDTDLSLLRTVHRSPEPLLPAPPRRSSSLHKIPPARDRPRSPDQSPLSSTLPHYRARSPAALELERVTRTLNLLKAEVNSIVRESNEDIPINISIQDSRPRSPYHPDKSPYYRARYHSAPQSPTGQHDATTSTTDILNPRRYSPGKEETLKEERERPTPTILLSTHSLEVPPDDINTPLFSLQLDSETLSSLTPTVSRSKVVPVRSQFYDQDHYEPECDPPALGGPTNGHHPEGGKREEQLLTPPPIPPRGGTRGEDEDEDEEGEEGDGGITLKGENLFDPYHIGTTYVVLSKQNHGRFKFSTTPDPNRSLPGSPRAARGSARSTPAKDLMPASPSSPVRLTPGASPARYGGQSPVRPAPGAESPLRAMRGSESPRPVIRPIEAPLTSAAIPAGEVLAPVAVMPKRELYQPRSLAGSLASLQLSRTDLGTAGRSSGRPASSFSPPLRAASPEIRSKSPEQPALRVFARPTREPAYREVAVDVPHEPPPVVPERATTAQEVEMEKKHPASREFHLHHLTTPPAPGGGGGPILHRSSSPGRSSLASSLRRKIPEVRMMGGEWKELAQRLGYDNSQIAAFAADYPDPGQALLDHWSKQKDAHLTVLLGHMKELGLWKTADTLDKTFDDIAV